jgi:hypothetical protein
MPGVIAAFEGWYLAELAVRDDMRCPAQALSGLEQIIRGNGVATTVGLFRKTGRAGLLERLRACAGSADPDVRQLARELLDRLDQP